MSVGYCPIPGMSQPRLSMTDDEKKRWLWRYRGSLEKEKALRADLQEQESRAAKTTAALTGMPGGGGDGQTLARAVESIIEAQQKLQAQINVCGAVRREVVVAIDQVQDERDHAILYRRYVLGQKWEVIAYEMHMDYTNVLRRHRCVLANLAIECKG